MEQKRAERRVNREYRKLYDQLSETEIAAFERIKERKRRVKRRKRIAVLTLMLLIVSMIAYFISPFSKIQTVNVYQNKIIDTSSILEDSGVKEGKSISLFTMKYFVGQNIRQNPFVNGVDIEKTMDGTMNITVSERWIIYKTFRDEQWVAYFADGTYAIIPDDYQVNATVLIPVENSTAFPYAELAQNLAYVPREIVDEISEIKHNPSNIEEWRFMFYMKDRNRVSILMSNIKTKMKYYFKLVEKSNGERFEYIMEYSKRGIIGKKIE